MTPDEIARPRTPSRRLLGAVLERAIRDAVGPLGTGSTACTPRERERVRRWFHCPSIEPMSFRWTCLMLDVDPGTVIQRLSSYDEDGDRQAAPAGLGER